jgi:integrase
MDMLAHGRTVDQWLAEWLKTKERDGTRASTIASYRWLVNKHIAPGIGKVRLDRLSPADVRTLVTAKLESSLSTASVAHMLRVLRVALNDAARLDLVTRNVASAVRMPKAEPFEANALTVEDARALVAATSNHRLNALWMLALVHGLRKGELLGLCWQDIDLANGTLWVRHSRQTVNGEVLMVPPKTRSSHAALPLPPSLVAILKRHRTRQQGERLKMGERWPGTDFVFTSATGTPIDPRNLHRQWVDLREDAGLTGLRLHDLRHSCASVLVALGVHPRQAMEWLRHSQISMTMNVYSHVDPESQRQVAEALERALFA